MVAFEEPDEVVFEVELGGAPVRRELLGVQDVGEVDERAEGCGDADAVVE